LFLTISVSHYNIVYAMLQANNANCAKEIMLKKQLKFGKNIFISLIAPSAGMTKKYANFAPQNE